MRAEDKGVGGGGSKEGRANCGVNHCGVGEEGGGDNCGIIGGGVKRGGANCGSNQWGRRRKGKSQGRLSSVQQRRRDREGAGQSGALTNGGGAEGASENWRRGLKGGGANRDTDDWGRARRGRG